MVSAAAAARDGMMEYVVLYHNGGSIDDTREEGSGRAGVMFGTYTHSETKT